MANQEDTMNTGAEAGEIIGAGRSFCDLAKIGAHRARTSRRKDAAKAGMDAEKGQAAPAAPPAPSPPAAPITEKPHPMGDEWFPPERRPKRGR